MAYFGILGDTPTVYLSLGCLTLVYVKSIWMHPLM